MNDDVIDRDDADERSRFRDDWQVIQSSSDV